MNGKVLGGVIVASLGALVAFFLVQNRENLSSEIPTPSLEESGMSGPPDGDSQKMDVDLAAFEDVAFEYEALLSDITENQEVRGLKTGGLSGGEVGASFKDGRYLMRASFTNLPDPKNDDFYEGWLIRLFPFKFISTGKAVKAEGIYTNVYSSEEDLTTLTRYVLTIEPNDGDPAPGPHILEGDMEAEK